MGDTTVPTTNKAADISFPPPFVSEPKGYALSGKIMLSAIIILFGVVVIMVCFHIYARWYILRARRRNVLRARRRTHLVFYIDPNGSSNGTPVSTTAARGLDPAAVNSLPTFVYNVNKSISNNDGNSVKKVVEPEKEGEVLECAVCLSEFELNEIGRVLPKCNHCFHLDCIDMWFHSHDTCPLCRAPVEPTDSVPEEKNDLESHPVDLTELTQSPSQLDDSAELRDEVGPSSASVGGRRKGLDLVGVTIEVPRRCHSFSFMNPDETGLGLGSSRSPTSRVLSLKRFLSRDRKSPLPSPSGSRVELDVELGRVDPVTPTSQGCLTPKLNNVNISG